MSTTPPSPLDSQAIKQAAATLGATLTGIADLDLLKGIETHPGDLLAPYTRAISMAVHLSDDILDAIEDRPTPLYAFHYKQINDLLDDLSAKICSLIQNSGAHALPVPASLTVDRERNVSFISHKAVAIAAGLGWQGKSLLLVTPQHGPRVRLTTVLTDLPLTPDARLKNRCGTCTACTDACPAGAIRNVSTDWHYASRNEAIDLDRCYARLTENAETPLIGNLVCGVCIRACPFGARSKRG